MDFRSDFFWGTFFVLLYMHVPNELPSKEMELREQGVLQHFGLARFANRFARVMQVEVI